ncbi:MAG: carboxypeptidase-like regulatory domain-containing protein [Cytophagales bacterium]|nr:carboxypeptidase-like regulatory domain-containing protein [Cytophagales bacterium]
MKALFIYQIEAAICMCALSLLYFALWKNDTNIVFKRYLLLSIPVLSLSIPLLDFSLNLVDKAYSTPVEYLVYLPNQLQLQSALEANSREARINMWQICSGIWLAGAFIMCIRLFISYWKIWEIFRRSYRPEDGNFRLIDDPVQSFSFFNLIIINKSIAKTSSKDHILAHELVHSRQQHSIDVVFFETVKVFQWFNPWLWWITYQSRQNMEYIADQMATETGADKKKYQYAIIHHAADAGYQLLKTQFSKTNLKKRIVMMNQPTNQKIHRCKLMAVLPVLLLLFMSFSLRVEHLDLELKEILPLFGTSSDQKPSATDDIPAPGVKPNRQIEVRAIPADRAIPEKGHAHRPLDDAVSSSEENQPWSSTGDAESHDRVPPANKNLKSTSDALNTTPETEIGFNDKAGRLSEEGSKRISGAQRGNNAGAKVIMPVAVRRDDEGEFKKIQGRISTEDGKPVAGCNVIIKGTTIGTVSDDEGRFAIKMKPEQTRLVFAFKGMETRVINIEDKDKLDVILKAVNGPTSFFQVDEGKLKIRDKAHPEEQGLPLYILDGVEIDKSELESLSPDNIESISVLKDAAAKNLYGENAKNGVIIINSKDYTQDYPKIKNMKRVIRGRVSSKTGEPVAGADVIIKGTRIGTVTDLNGNYVLNVGPEHDELIISHKTMKSKTVSSKKKTVIDVTLEKASD